MTSKKDRSLLGEICPFVHFEKLWNAFTFRDKNIKFFFFFGGLGAALRGPPQVNVPHFEIRKVKQSLGVQRDLVEL